MLETWIQLAVQTEQVKFKLLEWASQILDLNPIKDLWATL